MMFHVGVSLILVVTTAFGHVTTVSASSSATGSTLHICNRGLCYHKKEDPFAKLSYHSTSLSASQLDLLSLLGAASLLVDEAVECLDCPPTQQTTQRLVDSEEPQTNTSWEILEEDDLDIRKSWKEEPKRGQCLDDDLGCVFDCNLVQILDDGLVLIEDLRSSGTLTEQPTSNFSNKRNKHKKQKWQATTTALPPVVVTGEDPTEDFRTVVELNMMGI